MLRMTASDRFCFAAAMNCAQAAVDVCAMPIVLTCGASDCGMAMSACVAGSTPPSQQTPTSAPVAASVAMESASCPACSVT